MQALYLLGLDPIAETLADGHSYGFRRDRCCADAMERVHNIYSNANSAEWVMEADIAACYDRISWEWLLKDNNVPMDKEILRKWLQAGFLEKHVWYATTEGTPQGGIISPVLANLALDGLQRVLEERFPLHSRRKPKVHLARYADDFIISGTSKVLLEYEVKPVVEQFLSERGLELSHEKTRITHIEDGFDFLGQTARLHRDGKVLIRPSKRSIKTFLAKIRETIKNSGNKTAGQLIWRLNQQIKGWTMYHRFASSKSTFRHVDAQIFRSLWRWCRRRHRKKTTEWIKKKYWPRVGNKDWVFTGTLRDGKGNRWPITLMSAAKVRVVRYTKIRCEANPYDPEWEQYLEERQGWKMTLTLGGLGRIEFLWEKQNGRCPVCEQQLRLEDADWQIHHIVWRTHGGQNTYDNLELLHANCHRQIHVQAES